MRENQKWTMLFDSQNVSIGIVGKDTEFTILDEAATAVYLAEIEGDAKRGRATGPDTVQDDKPPQEPGEREGPRDPEVAVATEQMETE